MALFKDSMRNFFQVRRACRCTAKNSLGKQLFGLLDA
jgi:hypothetical protein